MGEFDMCQAFWLIQSRQSVQKVFWVSFSLADQADRYWYITFWDSNWIKKNTAFVLLMRKNDRSQNKRRFQFV